MGFNVKYAGPASRVSADSGMGNRPGIDHGTGFILDLTEAGTHTLFPIGVSLDQFMRWTWRVKTFHAQGSVAWHNTGGSGTVVFSTYPTNVTPIVMERYDDSTAASVVDEREIATAQLPTGFLQLVGNSTPGLNQTINLFINTITYYDFVAKLFYPRISISLPFGLNQILTTISDLVFPGWTISSTGISVILDGIAIPLFYSRINSSPPVTFDSCDFTITPSAFYAYRNGLGQDVYDTTSGVQINDPFAMP